MATEKDLLWMALGLTVTLLVGLAYALFAAPRVAVHRATWRDQQGSLREPRNRPVEVAGHVLTSRPMPGPPDRPYVPARATPDFHQVGFVHDASQGVRAPLYGRPAPRNPSRWQYYVAADSDIRIGAKSKGMNCMADVGCPEIESGESLQIPELAPGDVKATVYDRLY